MEQYQWLDIRQDGDIVTTVARGTSQSGRATFLTEPYTGTRPYHLTHHEGSLEHQASAQSQAEMMHRARTKQCVEDTILAQGVLMVDGEAFVTCCDAFTGSVNKKSRTQQTSHHFVACVLYSAIAHFKD